MSDILIKAKGISKIYDPSIYLKKGEDFYALLNVDFTLKKGDFISIMGPSGSGKSTLLNCISTLDTVSKGTVEILGTSSVRLNDKQISTFRYQQLGFVFQNHNLITTLSMYDNIAAPIMLGGKSPGEIDDRVRTLAKELGISHILHKFPSDCSGGEAQRVAIARALSNSPSIIVCDEPTGNLDSTNSHELLRILSTLHKQGMSVIIVTHDAMVASYASTFMYMRDGQIQTVLQRNEASQIDFYHEIVHISMQDSVLKLFHKNEEDIKAPKETRKTPKVIEKEVIDTTQAQEIVKVYALLEGQEIHDNLHGYRILTVTEEALHYKALNRTSVTIVFAEIKKIKMSIQGIFKTAMGYSEYIFYVTLTIEGKGSTQRLLLQNTGDLLPMFTRFEEANVRMEDPIGLIQVYQKYTDHYERTRYFQRNRKRLQKEWGIKV